jgi:hypothetical protein
MIGILRLFTIAAGRASRSVNRFAGLAATAAVMIVSAGAAGPIEVALVEDLSSNSASVQLMDYLQVGRVIHLAPMDTLVLTYMTSCVREKITGGTVTIGTDSSEVQLGQVVRSRGLCGEKKGQITSERNLFYGSGRVPRSR